MITHNARVALSAYTTTLNIVDEGAIIDDLEDELIVLLQAPSYTDMTKANKLISDSIGEKVCVTLFLNASLIESIECGMIDQADRIKKQIKSIICHNTTKKQATQIAVSIAQYYEFEIIKQAKINQREDDYSTATEGL